MKLLELHPHFLKIIDVKTYKLIDNIKEADGIQFLCPKCFIENDGIIGTHSIICWTIGKVPDDLDPKPGRWNLIGTCYNDLSLQAGSSSVALLGGCNAHFFIRDGNIEMVE